MAQLTDEREAVGRWIPTSSRRAEKRVRRPKGRISGFLFGSRRNSLSEGRSAGDIPRANKSKLLGARTLMALLYKHRAQSLLFFFLLRVDDCDWNEFQLPLLVFHGASKGVEMKSHEAQAVQPISFEVGNKEVRC